MPYQLLADAVVVVHAAFVALVVLGGFLALRVPRAWWFHLAAVAYGAGLVVFGWSCPLTDIERALREAGGDPTTPGFVERYLEGVIYPGDRTTEARAVAALVIAVSWALLARHHRQRRHGAPSPPDATSGSDPHPQVREAGARALPSER